MDINRCADIGPAKNPLGGAGFHIDATVAHDVAEIMMPIGAVNRIVGVKPGNKGDIREIIIRSMH